MAQLFPCVISKDCPPGSSLLQKYITSIRKQANMKFSFSAIDSEIQKNCSKVRAELTMRRHTRLLSRLSFRISFVAQVSAFVALSRASFACKDHNATVRNLYSIKNVRFCKNGGSEFTEKRAP